MRKKNGFTLVELLATIVILSLIVLAATPAVLSIAKKIRTSMYCTKIEMVKKAGQMYGQENNLTQECFVGGTLYNCKSITVNDLIVNHYITADGKNNTLTDPRDKSSMNNTTVTVYTRYNKYYTAVAAFGCGDITSVAVGRNIVLTLNGGTLSESLPSIIGEGDTITLTTPVKYGYQFTGWTVTGEGNSITNNILTVGSETIYLTANWEINSHTLTVNANGGTWSGTTPQTVEINNSITINNPTKAGHQFTGWTITGTGSTVDGTTFTMGTSDTTLTASWLRNSYILTINPNGGTWNGTSPQNLFLSDSVTINNPTKSGYAFAGWSITGTGSTINGTTFTMGTNDTTLSANWMTTTPTTFSYTGAVQTFTAPTSGYYKIELWGAKGYGDPAGGRGGYGAYTSGIIYLSSSMQIYIYVGGIGVAGSSSKTFNGGGGGQFGGGASTDIRLISGTWNDAASLKSRIMVAGAGAGNDTRDIGGGGGGLSGYASSSNTGKGGTQIAGGAGTEYGGFGYGGGNNTSNGGGGSGYYGGGNSTSGSDYGGGGGSSYISGHTGCVAIISSSSTSPRTGTGGAACSQGGTDNLCSIHYSGYYFSNTLMIDGSGYTWTNTKAVSVGTNLMPNPSGGTYSSGYGNTGNGYARITYISN